MPRPLTACILTVCLFVIGGCNKEAEQKVAMRKACLAELGTAYLAFYAANGRSPAGIEELASYVEKDAKPDDAKTDDAKPGDKVAIESAKRLREGDIVMYWQAGLHDDAAENEKYVLGFEAAVPRAGGYIVTGGGTVVLVSPKSFGEYKEFS